MASYSADRIGMGEPVRKSFSWNGALWVSVGLSGAADDISAKAYRLAHVSVYDGNPMTYLKKIRHADTAHSDPSGFYNGMIVRHSGDEFVLCGPPVTFTKGEQQQFSLF